ncbi:MAG: hypothetical protein ACR2RE_25795, partial [Geminicoccaceae bacterium]
MRKMLMASAASVAIFGAGQAMAQQASQTTTAEFASACGSVLGLENITIANATNGASGFDDFQLSCTDPAGARVTITATNNELAHTFPNSTEALDYTANLSSPSLIPINGAGADFVFDGSAPALNTVDLDPL